MLQHFKNDFNFTFHWFLFYFFIFSHINVRGLRRSRIINSAVTASASSTVITGVEAKDLRVGLGDAERLVSSPSRVVANMGLASILARVVLRRTVKGTILSIGARLKSRRSFLFLGTSTTAICLHSKVVNATTIGDDRIGHIDAKADVQLATAIPILGDLHLDLEPFIHFG
jgi:hypothetical protein